MAILFIRSLYHNGVIEFNRVLKEDNISISNIVKIYHSNLIKMIIFCHLDKTIINLLIDFSQLCDVVKKWLIKKVISVKNKSLYH